uniref:Ig-like domain-containing protein n=1 Tax=Falco tinnunculus TaxID=100819 RepID=A0A8C4TZE9_FALTI
EHVASLCPFCESKIDADHKETRPPCPVQTPRSITKSAGTVRLMCDLKGIYGDFSDTIVHWYQQKLNDAPKRILYHGERTVVGGDFQAHRYMVEKFPSQRLCTLTINKVTPDDTANYYCAYSD